MEAVAQNQAAIVWWKVPSQSRSEKQGSQKTGGNSKETRGKAQDGVLGKGGEKCAVEGSGSEEGGGNVVGESGERDTPTGDHPPPKTIGFVVYRYRLDGREWHKKGATSVDDSKAVSTTVKALSNGLVYRCPSLRCVRYKDILRCIVQWHSCHVIGHLTEECRFVCIAENPWILRRCRHAFGNSLDAAN